MPLREEDDCPPPRATTAIHPDTVRNCVVTANAFPHNHPLRPAFLVYTYEIRQELGMSTEEKTVRYQIFFKDSEFMFDHTVAVADDKFEHPAPVGDIP